MLYALAVSGRPPSNPPRRDERERLLVTLVYVLHVRVPTYPCLLR